MKKSIFVISVILLTFSVGLVSTVLWYKGNPKLESYEEAFNKEIPKVEFCELINNPEKYNGKIILLKTWLFSDRHGKRLGDTNCETTKKYSFIAASNYSQNEEVIEKQIRQWKQRTLYIVAVGRFTLEEKNGYSDAWRDRINMHFEINRIEFVADGE